MWIRTQNKYILANANSFRICKNCIDDWVYYAINGHYDRYEQELGIYSTKEKALKVLDEIQRAVGSAKVYSTNRASNGHSMSNEYVMVYQMPADEDVEA